jgi:type VI secretion system protein ImpA
MIIDRSDGGRRWQAKEYGKTTMGADPTVDVEALLAPIPGENECGGISRFDPVFDEIKKARSEENRDAIEGGATQADWRLVIARAGNTLQNKAKDLMLAAYLAEALSESAGFAGFRDGLRVVTGLLERYWDGVYPLIEEGDIDRRLAPLIWMTEAERGSRLPNRLRELPIIPLLDGGGLSLAFSKSTYAPPQTENENNDSYEQRRAEAEGRAKALQDAVTAAPLSVFASLRQDLKECLAEVGRFDQVLNQRFSVQGPSVTPLREAIEDCAALVGKMFKEKGGLEEEQKAAEGGEEVQPGEKEGVTTEPAGGTRAGPIRNREDAFRRLAEVAAFFRQTEPHSPIPYLIERAVTWGGMTLEQLLEELIKDSGTRDQIGELLGFRRT